MGTTVNHSLDWFRIHPLVRLNHVTTLYPMLSTNTPTPFFHFLHCLSQYTHTHRTDGTPSLGWSDTTSFLILPVVLVLSQFLSMQLMQPDSEEARAQQPAVLKFLPLMIGYFSLSVPAALTIYWFANNIITTASTLYIKSTVAPPDTAVNGATATMTPDVSAFQPPVREKPSGFAATSYSEGGVSPITAVDAEIVEDDTSEEETPVSGGEGIDVKKRGSKKKKKKRKN